MARKNWSEQQGENIDAFADAFQKEERKTAAREIIEKVKLAGGKVDDQGRLVYPNGDLAQSAFIDYLLFIVLMLPAPSWASMVDHRVATRGIIYYYFRLVHRAV